MINFKKYTLLLGFAALCSYQLPVLGQDDEGLDDEEFMLEEEEFLMSVEEIIVTARKREESIQDVPISITAVTEEMMLQRDYRGLEDIAQSTAGFTYEGFSTSGASGNPVVRGLTNTFTTARIQNVAVFLNGVYLQSQSMLNIGLLDMQRVEVLKGPQSALFGRNSFSGAINYITREPSDLLDFGVSVTVGKDDRRDVKADITGPLGSDMLLGKFAVGYTEFDGHTENKHPLAGVDVSGPDNVDNLGGWEDTIISTGFVFFPTDTVEIEFDYYKAELKHENQPYYFITGAKAVANSLTQVNDLNCNNATVTGLGGDFTAATGNTAWCGKLPLTNPELGDIVTDPRGVGTESETEVTSFKVFWEMSDYWSMYYLFGRTDSDSYTNGGGGDRNPLTGSSFVAGLGRPDIQANITQGSPINTLQADSHEFRFEWESEETFSGSFGAYFSNVEDDDRAVFFYMPVCNGEPENIANCNLEMTPSVATPIDPAVAENGVDTSPLFPGGPVIAQGTMMLAQQHGKTTSFSEYEDDIAGIFTELSVELNDEWTVRVEARYSREEKAIRRVADTFGLGFGESVDVNPNPDVVNELTSSIAIENDKETFTYFTPRFNIEWAINEDSLAYFTVATGLKSGGFNNTPPAALVRESERARLESDGATAEEITARLAQIHDQTKYDEEKNTTYELGSKNVLLNSRLLLNLSLYYVDWKDVQGTEASQAESTDFSRTVVGNVGDARNLGFEMEGTYNFTPWLSADFGFSRNSPEFKSGVKYLDAVSNVACNGTAAEGGEGVCPTDGDVGGNSLPRTPKLQTFIGANLKTVTSAGWGVNARYDVNYLSKQYVTPLNAGHTGSRTIYNMSINVQAPNNWDVNFWVKNVFDKEYVASAFVVPQFNQYIVALGGRRTLGFTVNYRYNAI